MTIKTKDKDIKFNGNNEKRFQEWAIKTKAIGACKGWVKELTEDLTIIWKVGMMQTTRELL